MESVIRDVLQTVYTILFLACILCFSWETSFSLSVLNKSIQLSMFKICKWCRAYVFKIIFLPYYWHKCKSHVHFCWDPSLVRNKDKSKGNELWSFKLDKKKKRHATFLHCVIKWIVNLCYSLKLFIQKNLFKERFSDFLVLFGRTFKPKFPF